MPRSQLLCTICKTGHAKIRNEDDRQLRDWMVLGNEDNDGRRRRWGDEDDGDLVDLMGIR